MKPLQIVYVSLLAAGLLFIRSSIGFAHCDTMDGPVVIDAQAALQKGDVTPVLKWVAPEQESEIRGAFQQTLAVRELSPQARDLADRYFFETLVRVHRASEGEPYTGLKPAGQELEPAVAAADRALETGEVDGLLNMVQRDSAEGIRHRFHRDHEAKQHAGESVAAGREYVKAYVEFVHYAERLHNDATAAAHHVAAPKDRGHAH